MSCFSASRRKCERSSFTSESGISFILAFRTVSAMPLPLVWHYREDFNDRARNVVKDPHLVHAQPILWTVKATKPLDAAPARLHRLVPQMRFECGSQRGTNGSFEPLEVI